ncbi:MAG: hypothetical protein PHC51_09195 [bacterium]|nr:hypothetical protein [bacterium]
MNTLHLSQPTVSLLVPVNGQKPLEGVLAIKFREKHGGRYGLPGERYDAVVGGIEYHARACCEEELGFSADSGSFEFFIFRDALDRDNRYPVTLEKVSHKRDLPAEFKDSSAVTTHHRPDMVFIYRHDGIIVPEELKPEDGDEVSKVVALGFDEAEHAELAVSDDRALLMFYYDYLTGAIELPANRILPSTYWAIYRQAR